MQQFTWERVADPGFFAENRLPACSDHIWYESVTALGKGESALRQCLDGVWQFHYAENFTQVPEAFAAAAGDCRGWESIRVPGHIQMQGHGVPQYANIQYPWDGHENVWPGEIPQRFNPVGCYVKYFTVPEGWAGRPVHIRFDGAESGLAVFCNGSYVGYATDSFTPHTFDLTPYLQKGENKLSAAVIRWTSASWCEDQDFFRFSGLFRSVWLLAVPAAHIADVKLETPLAEDYSAGTLAVQLKTQGEGRVCAALYAPGGACVGRAEEALAAQGVLRFEIPVKAPLLWSAEVPNLYRLRLTVFDAAGRETEAVEQKTGFRRFVIRDGILELNGRRIVFRGVNRHEFSAKTGRAVAREETLRDVLTMKRNNINAIRTCHYPDDSYLYELCDEYGLYLLDECNLETHGTWDPLARGETDMAGLPLPHNKPEWQPMLLDRVESIYQRDKNHASVLIWSCGNESYGGKVIFEMSQRFRALDGSRPVHYEGICHDRSYNATSDIESRMYPPVEEIKAWLAKDRSKPFLCCEYAHAMGNSNGALYKYTDLTDTAPSYQGGFIWDYIDQAITKKDRYGREFQAYGGDFDDRPCDYSFSGNGIVYSRDRDASPKMQEVKYCYQAVTAEVKRASVLVKNKNLFVSTGIYDCTAALYREGVEVLRAPLAADVPPLSQKEYPLPFTVPETEGEYSVIVSFALAQDTLWAKKGYEVAFGQGVFGRFAPPALPAKAPEAVRGTLNWGAYGAGFNVIFSKHFRGLVSYRWAGRELLKSIPLPNFWRAPTENDAGNAMACRYGQWKLASMYVSPHEGSEFSAVLPRYEVQPDAVCVTYTYTLATNPRAECTLRWRALGDGTLEGTLHYDPVPGLSEMPEFGVMFQMDADFDRLQWYGLGEAETYADRKKGAKLGIFETTAQASMAKYLVPQECGNRADTRWARVTDENGRGLALWAPKPFNVSLLPYTPHELENAKHPFELPEVHYSVVRLSLAQMGVGGDDTWGARTHPEFLLPADQPLEFTFFLKGL